MPQPGYLQALFDHQTALNKAVPGGHITAGQVVMAESSGLQARTPIERGFERVIAAKRPSQFMVRAVAKQATVISYDAAFLMIALFFYIAAPVLITAKTAFSRLAPILVTLTAPRDANEVQHRP